MFQEELNASPFTKAVHAAKPAINALTAQRNYLAIRDLRSQIKHDVEEDKRIEQEKVRERQQLERERLEKAHKVMKEKTKEEARQQVDDISQRFTAQAEFHAARQARHLEQFEQQVRAAESKRPLVYSTTVRDLLQAEAHLVKLQQYEDAEHAKRKIGSAAHAEKKKYYQEIEQRIETRVNMRKDVLKAASDYMDARCRNEISMAKHRAAEGETLIDQRFDHTAEDMAHAHRLELRQNSLLKNLQCPPKMRQQKELASRGRSDAATLGVTTATTPAMAQKASRGTEALRRAVGSRYEVPSLCNSYGHYLDESAKKRDGEAAVELPPCAERY